MSKLASSHPDDGDLLRYADNELPAREAKKVESHLAACWQCRTELAELERTIEDCVRYRQSAAEALPEPPEPWSDIYRRFAEVDGALETKSLASRFFEGLRAAIGPPRRWVPAMAVLLVALLIVDQFRNAPSVQAAELLNKAAVAADSRSVTGRFIQIRTATGQVTRAINAARNVALSPAQEQILSALRPLFRAARYSWDDPLSARAFLAWRGALTDKRDEVLSIDTPAECYQIRTTTDSSSLVEATLTLRVDDLRPVEGTWRFRDREFVEITEVEQMPAPAVAAPEEVVQSIPVRLPEAATLPEPVKTFEPATPGEELKVFALLRQLDADLGEPVEVTRDGGKVVVSGVGVNPAIGRQIRKELEGVPRVTVRFSEPQVRPLPSEPRNPEAASTAGKQIEAKIEERLGGRLAYEQFTDEILEASEALMSRVHALRRLAKRFHREAENQLSSDERQLLWKLRNEHAVAVAELAVTLDERSRPALASLDAAATASFSATPLNGSWQDSTEELFRQARRAESLLAAMLGGVSPELSPEALPEEVLAGMAQFRAIAAEYMRITAE
ncbi:MAG: hypothetical protein GY953_18755 [bacterium]|nr:hypothetical protein [bacterium]